MKNNILYNQDKFYIEQAIDLAKEGIGKTGSNPSVGCVIVKNDNVISEARTSDHGRPHAEVSAIQKANCNLENSIFYITLEPCAHIGHTPSCVDEIIKHKPKKVVIAITDPDPRTNGKSIAKLRNNNIEVITDICKEEALEINYGFFKNKIINMPQIILKLGTSLDGKIASFNNDSKWITNEKSREYVHILRSQVNAIMVGTNSFIIDKPQLNCRIPGLEQYSPKPIILNAHNNISKETIIEFAKNREIILVSATNNKIEFNNKNIKKIECAIDNNGFILKSLFEILATEENINNILVEGGSKIATSLIKDDLVDDLYWFLSPMILGNDARAAINNLSIDKIRNSIHFPNQNIKILDNNIMFHLSKRIKI